MTRKERNNIIKFCEKLNNEEIENEYYRVVDECLDTKCDKMNELGYDILDIVEREKYEKYLRETVDLIFYICEERGIRLWEE